MIAAVVAPAVCVYFAAIPERPSVSSAIVSPPTQLSEAAGRDYVFMDAPGIGPLSDPPLENRNPEFEARIRELDANRSGNVMIEALFAKQVEISVQVGGGSLQDFPGRGRFSLPDIIGLPPEMELDNPEFPCVDREPQSGERG